jgi:ADP-ribosyl-[dinitrogen reductase] hydrolase
MAPCIIWNCKNLGFAIGESVAQTLITHGSTDCVTYTSALAHELWAGKALPQYEGLKNRPIKNSGYVADTYASAWHSVRSTHSFEDAIIDAINKGGDADTVGAVTGMIAGRQYGCTLDHPWVKQIQNYKILNGVLDQLLTLRNNSLF